MYPFINIRQHRTPATSLSSAPSRDGQGVGNDVPNERDSEYASSTEVTEIEFHRRASDYPRGGDELHATRGCASRGVSVFMYVLSFGAVSQAWPMRRTEVTTRCSYEELKHQIHTRGHASGSAYVTFLMFSAAIRYRYCTSRIWQAIV